MGVLVSALRQEAGAGLPQSASMVSVRDIYTKQSPAVLTEHLLSMERTLVEKFGEDLSDSEDSFDSTPVAHSATTDSENEDDLYVDCFTCARHC